MSVLCETCAAMYSENETSHMIYKHDKYFCSAKCVKIYEDIAYTKWLQEVKSERISFLDLPAWVRNREFNEAGFTVCLITIKSRVCPICGTTFYIDTKNPRESCSDECAITLKNKQYKSPTRLAAIGWNAAGWKGGLSYLPYCPKFNENLKARVRAFFWNICFECGMSEEENGRALSVHHINYDKQVCCNDKPALFVPLCDSCHSKTNHDRSYWESHFMDRLSEEYNYKCYFTKEEWASKLTLCKNLEVSV